MDLFQAILYASLLAAVYILSPFVLELRRVRKMAAKIPGPPANPIFGNVLQTAGRKFVGNGSSWNKFKQFFYRGDGIFRLWIGPILAVVVDDPIYANVVLTCPASSKKHRWYGVMSFLKNGLFVTNGNYYERLRKALSPSFYPKTVSKCHELMTVKALQAVQVLEKEVGKCEFDISETIVAYFLDITCEFMLGCAVNEMDKRKFNCFHSLNEIFLIDIQRLVKPAYFSDYYFYKSDIGKRYKACCREFNALPRYILEKRIKELEERGIDLKRAPRDFQEESYTDTIIKVGYENGRTLEEMATMLSDIPAAGSHTTAVVTSACLLYLAMHPKYQEDVYKEQLAVLGDEKRAPTIEELSRMPFLSWVQKEVQRLHAPPFVARAADEDMKIGDYSVPRGTVLVVLLNKLHRNSKYYDNPDEFNPYNFSPENVEKRPKQSFVPMSNGFRRCPGGLFAHLSTGTLLSVLLRHFTFSTDLKFSDLRFQQSLLLELASGYPVKITRR